MKMPRFLHKLYANFFGYFWLPCPICHKPFGGHEMAEGAYLMDTEARGWGVCKNCVDVAKELNQENLATTTFNNAV